MYKVMFKDNWDKHDDNWYDLTMADIPTMAECEIIIAEDKKSAKWNGEENRWSYTIVKEGK